MILFVKFENMPKCLYWQALKNLKILKNTKKYKGKKKKKEFQTPKYPLIPFPKRSDASGLMKRNFYRTTQLNDKEVKIDNRTLK